MNNTEWQMRKSQVIARGQGNAYPVYVDHAVNAEVWDIEGKRYIDFGTGIAVCNTGHSHPKVVAAVKQQVDKFSHTCFMVNPYENAVVLAEKLVALAPGPSDKKAIFVSTGAEAVENCIKIARAHTGRRGVIAFNGGFHGRTNLAMALTGKIAPYKQGFGPFCGDVYHVPYPIACHDVTEKEALRALKNVFKVDIAATDVAAIIIEPIQGEAGVNVPEPEYLKKVRSLCSEYNVLMIADEIQTGICRTGKLLASWHESIKPDLVILGKALSGGFYPVSGVLTSKKIMSIMKVGMHGSTFGGSPLAGAVSKAAIKYAVDYNLSSKSEVLGKIFRVASVITPKVPSEPTKILVKSSPTTPFDVSTPTECDIPRPSINFNPRILSRGVPYFTALGPAELFAIFPPIVE